MLKEGLIQILQYTLKMYNNSISLNDEVLPEKLREYLNQ